MLKRTAQKGANVGKRFLGVSGYTPSAGGHGNL